MVAMGQVRSRLALALGASGVLLDKQSQNWQSRMTNIVLTRILPETELVDEFYRRGLPREESLLDYWGQLLKYYCEEFRERTPAFQHWLETDSRRAYLGSRRWRRIDA